MKLIFTKIAAALVLHWNVQTPGTSYLMCSEDNVHYHVLMSFHHTSTNTEHASYKVPLDKQACFFYAAFVADKSE